MSGCGGGGQHDSGIAPWNAARAAAILGKSVLIGIVRFEADGETLIDRQQMHGIVTSVDPTEGVTIELQGEREGETVVIPPHLAAFEDAAPGEHHLHDTDELVVDPDLTTQWKLVNLRN